MQIYEPINVQSPLECMGHVTELYNRKIHTDRIVTANKIIPVINGALGAIPKSLENNLPQIVREAQFSKIQKIALL